MAQTIEPGRLRSFLRDWLRALVLGGMPSFMMLTGAEFYLSLKIEPPPPPAPGTFICGEPAIIWLFGLAAAPFAVLLTSVGSGLGGGILRYLQSLGGTLLGVGVALAALVPAVVSHTSLRAVVLSVVVLMPASAAICAGIRPRAPVTS